MSDSVRVLAPDTLRYTVWGENEDELYLLNTSHDVPAVVRMERAGKSYFTSVSPLRLKHVKLAADGLVELSAI